MKIICTTIAHLAVAWAATVIAQDANTAPAATIRATVAIIATQHLQKPAIDEPFCERWIRKYLETLDPAKLYFLAADISEFDTYTGKLPEFAKSGNTEFYKLVSQRYRLRLRSALDHALERLDRDFDFSINEDIPSQYEEWSNTNVERLERWRLQLKHDLLIERTCSAEPKEQIRFLRARYESILRQADGLTEPQAIGLYLDGLCRTADSQSGYFTQKEMDSFRGGMLHEYSIGLHTLSKDGRAIILGIAPGFRQEPDAAKILGCELLAIRSQHGDVYNCREIFPSTTRELVRYGLKQQDSVTLELYDAVQQNRFAINWPRK